MDTKFDKIQKHYYQTAELKRFYWQTQNFYIKSKELELFSDLLAIIQPGDKLLEVGCGEGANLVNLRSAGVENHFTGVDFSKTKITFCKQLNIFNTHFVQQDARNLEFNDKSFDIVLIRDLLHHTDNDRNKILSELLRVTKTNGTIIIIEANAHKFTNWCFATLFKHEKGIKNSTKQNMISLLDHLQYEIKNLEPTNLFRIVFHYKIGVPYLTQFKAICNLFNIIDKICLRLIPPKNWAYWHVRILKTD